MKKINCSDLVSLFSETGDIIKAFRIILMSDLKRNGLISDAFLNMRELPQLLELLYQHGEKGAPYRNYRELELVDIDYLPNTVYKPLIDKLEEIGYKVTWRDETEVELIMERIKKLQKEDLTELLKKLNNYIE